jgi:hypothetical protein
VEEQPLTVFALSEEGVPLRTLWDALTQAGFPVGIGVEIAGEAIDTQLDDPRWETAFVRWHEPELHDAWLLERYDVGTDEEAKTALARALQLAINRSESADKLIVIDHLRKTRVVYAFEILPAMLDDDDHPAFAALDVALRTLADATDGLIFAEGEAFYDADGEPLLGEVGEE